MRQNNTIWLLRDNYHPQQKHETKIFLHCNQRGGSVKHVLAGNKGNVIIVGDYFHPQAYIDYFSVIASVELLSAFHLACYHPSKSGGRILRSIPSRINSGRKLVLEKHNQIGVLLMKCPLSYNNIVGMIWF